MKRKKQIQLLFLFPMVFSWQKFQGELGSRHLFAPFSAFNTFGFPGPFPQVGLHVIWPFRSWVRGSRGRCGTLPMECWGLATTARLGHWLWGWMCRAGHCLARAKPDLHLAPHIKYFKVASLPASHHGKGGKNKPPSPCARVVKNSFLRFLRKSQNGGPLLVIM